MGTSNIPLWGQAWELTVQVVAEDGTTTSTTLTSNAWEPDALRMTFAVETVFASSPWWHADISIYNLDSPDAQNILFGATWVILKAGFQTGPNLYSTIWSGPVLQTLFTRENVVDQKITFHCLAGPLVADQIVNFAIGPFASQAQLVARMAAEIDLPDISTANGTLGQQASVALSAKRYPRGNTVFGTAAKLMNQIAADNFLQFFQDGKQAYISEVGSTKTEPDLIYSPPFPPNYTGQMLSLPAGTTQSIIGTPIQTQYGCTFTVLLDPRLKIQLPPLLVELKRTQIIQMTRPDPSANSALPTPLSNDLKFFVAKVRHIGDTRGNDWQTEVTGFSTTYSDNLLNGIFSPNSMT